MATDTFTGLVPVHATAGPGMPHLSRLHSEDDLVRGPHDSKTNRLPAGWALVLVLSATLIEHARAG